MCEVNDDWAYRNTKGLRAQSDTVITSALQMRSHQQTITIEYLLHPLNCKLVVYLLVEMIQFLQVLNKIVNKDRMYLHISHTCKLL